MALDLATPDRSLLESATRSSPVSHPRPAHPHTRTASAQRSFSVHRAEIETGLPDVPVDDDGFEEIDIAHLKKTATPIRQALGSRLLSTFSDAKVAAAAATSASGLQRSKSIFHARARPLANFIPTLSSVNTDHTTNSEDEVSQEREERTPKANKIFGDLFSGQSAPIRLGIAPSSPVKEKEESEFIMEYRSALTGGNKPPLAKSTTTARSSSKFSWFGAKTQPTMTPAPAASEDELSTMNIPTALSVDSTSPRAFDDLLVNATALLTRMQTSYREKCAFVAFMQPELEVQREEVEESETRSRHLKLQLEELGRRAEEQDKAMHDLVTQLAEQKCRSREAIERAANSIRVARPSSEGSSAISAGGDTTPRRQKRGSAGSASDSGFESEADTESVLSAAPDTPVSAPRFTLTPTLDGQDWTTPKGAMRSAARNFSRPSTPDSTRLGSDGAAWATVAQLRAENNELAEQVRAMEEAVEGCLDLVSGGVRS